MYIEFHDDDVDNEVHGTRLCVVGKRGGLIETDREAEGWVTDVLSGNHRMVRAFVLDRLGAVAAYAKVDGEIKCLAKQDYYSTQLRLADRRGTGITTVSLPAGGLTGSSFGQVFFSTVLIPPVSVAVVRNEEHLVFACERSPDGRLVISARSAGL